MRMGSIAWIGSDCTQLISGGKNIVPARGQFPFSFGKAVKRSAYQRGPFSAGALQPHTLLPALCRLWSEERFPAAGSAQPSRGSLLATRRWAGCWRSLTFAPDSRAQRAGGGLLAGAGTGSKTKTPPGVQTGSIKPCRAGCRCSRLLAAPPLPTVPASAESGLPAPLLSTCSIVSQRPRGERKRCSRSRACDSSCLPGRESQEFGSAGG